MSLLVWQSLALARCGSACTPTCGVRAAMPPMTVMNDLNAGIPSADFERRHFQGYWPCGGVLWLQAGAPGTHALCAHSAPALRSLGILQVRVFSMNVEMPHHCRYLGLKASRSMWCRTRSMWGQCSAFGGWWWPCGSSSRRAQCWWRHTGHCCMPSQPFRRGTSRLASSAQHHVHL